MTRKSRRIHLLIWGIFTGAIVILLIYNRITRTDFTPVDATRDIIVDD